MTGRGEGVKECQGQGILISESTKFIKCVRGCLSVVDGPPWEFYG